MKKAWVLYYPLSAQRRLWSEWVFWVFTGRTVTLLVLSCRGSYIGELPGLFYYCLYDKRMKMEHEQLENHYFPPLIWKAVAVFPKAISPIIWYYTNIRIPVVSLRFLFSGSWNLSFDVMYLSLNMRFFYQFCAKISLSSSIRKSSVRLLSTMSWRYARGRLTPSYKTEISRTGKIAENPVGYARNVYQYHFLSKC